MPFFGFGPLLLVLIAAGVVYYFFGYHPSRDRSREAASLEILDRRYASGEITKEQYEEMKGDLKKH
ncbi:SHOCT domain-containing protein [Mesorhizobium erdmanii]|uniref:SHOCT domain-containing protein n=1 Tax=Mesorhizobium erdmanii TaxID=1777866 RepID=UPI00040BD66C|nr:SHOCT domain-containing protein [Mesorhizobium erdmanii]